VAGRNRVPSPATGKMALRIGFMIWGPGPGGSERRMQMAG
jgi:hypothetical protein